MPKGGGRSQLGYSGVWLKTVSPTRRWVLLALCGPVPAGFREARYWLHLSEIHNLLRVIWVWPANPIRMIVVMDAPVEFDACTRNALPAPVELACPDCVASPNALANASVARVASGRISQLSIVNRSDRHAR